MNKARKHIFTPKTSGGAKLCIDTSVVAQQRSVSAEVVIMQLSESGLYRVRDAQAPNIDNERDFSPSCINHVYLDQPVYKKGEKILFSHKNSWATLQIALA